MIAEAVAICCRLFVVEEMMMIKEMSIDLETYSDVDIKKSGAYRYVESPEFEILLFAVSIMVVRLRCMIWHLGMCCRRISFRHWWMIP